MRALRLIAAGLALVVAAAAPGHAQAVPPQAQPCPSRTGVPFSATPDPCLGPEFPGSGELDTTANVLPDVATSTPTVTGPRATTTAGADGSGGGGLLGLIRGALGKATDPFTWLGKLAASLIRPVFEAPT